MNVYDLRVIFLKNQFSSIMAVLRSWAEGPPDCGFSQKPPKFVVYHNKIEKYNNCFFVISELSEIKRNLILARSLHL